MLEKLKRRLPDATSEMLLMDLLEEASAFIRAYTNRDEVPAELEDAQVHIAAVLFNRMGMEGETNHAEGGITHTAQILPDDIRVWLNACRCARTV